MDIGLFFGSSKTRGGHIMNILVVDDSAFSQNIISKLLKKYLPGVTIDLAKDGEEGLKKFKNIKPDYTFVDLLMPKMNGKDLIKSIKGFEAKAKIIVLSADVQKSTKEEMESSGVITFINKPFNDEKAKTICELIKGEQNEA